MLIPRYLIHSIKLRIPIPPWRTPILRSHRRHNRHRPLNQDIRVHRLTTLLPSRVRHLRPQRDAPRRTRRGWRQVTRADVTKIEKPVEALLCYVEDGIVWVHHGPVVEDGAEDGGFGGGEFVDEGFLTEEEVAVAAALEGEGFKGVGLVV